MILDKYFNNLRDKNRTHKFTKPLTDIKLKQVISMDIGLVSPSTLGIH